MSACSIHASICAFGTVRVRPSEQSRNRSPAHDLVAAQVERQVRLDPDRPGNRVAISWPPSRPTLVQRCGRASSARACPAASDRRGCRPPRARRSSRRATSSTTTVLPLRSASVGVRSPVRSRWSLTCCSRCRAASIVRSKRRIGHQVRERVAHHVAGDLAVAVAAQAVGHGPEADLRPLDERVLVDLAHPPDVGRGRRAEADRRRRLSTRISSVAPVSTRAGTERQRYSAHAPSSSATNVLGCGRPFDDQAAGLDHRRPSVHHSTSGSYSDEGAATAAARRPARDRAVDPIGICHSCDAVAQDRRRRRVEHDPRRQRDRLELLAQHRRPARRSARNRLVGRQRFDHQTLGAVEERAPTRTPRRRIDVGRQLARPASAGNSARPDRRWAPSGRSPARTAGARPRRRSARPGS